MSTMEGGNGVAVEALVVRNLEWVLEVNRSGAGTKYNALGTIHCAIVPSTLYPLVCFKGHRALVLRTIHSVEYIGYQECVPLYPLGTKSTHWLGWQSYIIINKNHLEKNADNIWWCGDIETAPKHQSTYMYTNKNPYESM